MEVIKLKSKKPIANDAMKEMITDASATDTLMKAVKDLAKEVKAGKGVDEKAMKEYGAGGVMAMFMRWAVQSAAVETEPKAFWKEFNGGKG